MPPHQTSCPPIWTRRPLAQPIARIPHTVTASLSLSSKQQRHHSSTRSPCLCRIRPRPIRPKRASLHPFPFQRRLPPPFLCLLLPLVILLIRQPGRTILQPLLHPHSPIPVKRRNLFTPQLVTPRIIVNRLCLLLITQRNTIHASDLHLVLLRGLAGHLGVPPALLCALLQHLCAVRGVCPPLAGGLGPPAPLFLPVDRRGAVRVRRRPLRPERLLVRYPMAVVFQQVEDHLVARVHRQESPGELRFFAVPILGPPLVLHAEHRQGRALLPGRTMTEAGPGGPG
ncbi:unnamed protein product [Chondrus crispus]|uniref:Uncharacterized protein n=1 Tax=Chondrus crispus TaxID=2769 RepID=R7QMR0_CHOCR|nr:unnamed protein product [Chondrus crispus]CDF38771.1 unnamed protein product [Chondrus crispus]|eukprot:XP_005718676.1 unnamed protein product [Chondrus crispus]